MYTIERMHITTDMPQQILLNHLTSLTSSMSNTLVIRMAVTTKATEPAVAWPIEVVPT